MWGRGGEGRRRRKNSHVSCFGGVGLVCLLASQSYGLSLVKAEATPRSVMQVACTSSVQFIPLFLYGCESWS